MMGMVLFTRLTPNADYFSNVLPGLVVTGLGLGLIFAPAIASATAGVRAKRRRRGVGAREHDPTDRWVDGTRAAQHHRGLGDGSREPACTGSTERATRRHSATLHGYAVAFWWAAGFFGVGAILTFGLLESGVSRRRR